MLRLAYNHLARFSHQARSGQTSRLGTFCYNLEHGWHHSINFCSRQELPKLHSRRSRYVTSQVSRPSDPPTTKNRESLCKSKTLSLKEALEAAVDMVSRKRHASAPTICISVLSPPSITLIKLLSTLGCNEQLIINLLPVDYSLLERRLKNGESASSHKKHVIDNWRSLMIEAGTDLLITTHEYYYLVAPICHGLTIPTYVMTDRPTLLDEQEFDASMKAGHGYFNLINRPQGEESHLSGPLLSGSPKLAKLRIFSEIGSCKGKVAIHTCETLQAESDRIQNILKLKSSDHVINCLFPHEYAYLVYGIMATLNVGARLHQPLKTVPLTSYSGLKLQFPLTTQRPASEAVPLAMGKSIFDHIRHNGIHPTVLFCNSQTFRMLADFFTCDDLSKKELDLYIYPWRSLERIVVFQDISQLHKQDLTELLKVFMEKTSLGPHVILIYVLPEAGAVAYRDFWTSPTKVMVIPGCEIKETDSNFTVMISSTSLFKEYHMRPRATSEALENGKMRLVYDKNTECTRLMDNHLDYVHYFKRKRERMARYPQGYVKRVPVRTQFWGNFTGKHKHHSVL